MSMWSLLILSSVIFVPNFSSITGPFSADFIKFLGDNGYGSYNLERHDLGASGSYGGRLKKKENVTNQPVIFIHGNSDGALHAGLNAPGWDVSIQYFLDHGYKASELYATTWGDRLAVNAALRTHNCQTLLFLRHFIEAVIDYTKADKIDIVAHSMGVTLGRKVIKGGAVTAHDGNCDLGKSLKKKVDTFYGISGGNFGLCSCAGSMSLFEPTCNHENGYWPGDSCPGNFLCGINNVPCNNMQYSSMLTALNTDGKHEGDFVYSIWSTADDLIMYGDQVWGRPTSYIVGSTANKTYTNLSHMQTKANTAADQYEGVVNHHV